MQQLIVLKRQLVIETALIVRLDGCCNEKISNGQRGDLNHAMYNVGTFFSRETIDFMRAAIPSGTFFVLNYVDNHTDI